MRRKGKCVCLVSCNIEIYKRNNVIANPQGSHVYGIGIGNNCTEAEEAGEAAAKAHWQQFTAGRSLGAGTRHCGAVWCVG